jgi:hypothetical protein
MLTPTCGGYNHVDMLGPPAVEVRLQGVHSVDALLVRQHRPATASCRGRVVILPRIVRLPNL